MIIYPTIELQNGRCVSLPRGNMSEAAIWHVDPVEKARDFAQAGAEWMHLTDFDAVTGDGKNRDLVLRIIREAGLPVQLGGGFRSRDRIEEWIELGAGRIVVGTLAAQNPHLVRELAERHVDQIVLAVDVWQGHVMIEGWKAQSAYTAEGFIAAFKETPFAAIIVTDIAADIEGADAALGMIEAIARSTRVPVIASGIVRTLDDISRLRLLGDVSGAIVGRALFNRTVDLGEALREARPERQKVAEFL
ncbi:HisA/HisF-related TIM barrel protein [Albidovulum sp.]|uniref:1-(5-phosphoribosyl)-5-[(5- phosphoribosylamino)methylideneamino]imidazole-4- carboxamide isomerase n=1 Tax=Albidovulum sp. TaxID=1872424 RepID=UPI001D6F1BD5|nr:1-(5-phosphoribosyl)-5-[(5-phosphoribosylamino)methylideneamino] imidazole-4-carboxamide isomerase [Paracoccaceae bacterium]MCC0046856.1 1-(5-phosphoribosyl)-5-[(5-phosphoribosylamino)methylideneamino] imidazole-4-carboxamide isomerase [Defluviimonas sp.]HPE26265.1 1-(5-phosphoribosyl)-5-[(5-phosphoribosylamino)methylideneamino] imidazole-4-carboxamide isomerase [Albidovulum sp.]MCB2118989.1 1-(5-phosphoribosyl)-5-[(5-phosphoribosylamino)methylideneamino] imidazole-4-carboxamide isomerase [Pa